MPARRILLTRARVVLPDATVAGLAVLLEDDCILALDPDGAPGAREEDLSGHWLMPGLVDLHCDALEKEIEPRPGVHFPLPFAVANADRRNAACGITTVYHAISFAHDELGVRNVDMAARAARAVHAHGPEALVDNRVHARWEITDPSARPVLEGLLDEHGLELLSFMDHSPGQGQFKTLEAYRDYVVRTYHRSPAEAERMAREKLDARAGALESVAALAGLARARGSRLASHDDDSPDRVAAMAALGVAVSEFPVNAAAAAAARRLGLSTVFGAPNIVRGGSQSGSMRALEAVQAGLADCLCADYAPATMLPAVMRLPRLCALDLPAAVRMATRAPALAAGLSDRGEIAPGLRADLVAVRDDAPDWPRVSRVWSAGRLACRTDHPA